MQTALTTSETEALAHLLEEQIVNTITRVQGLERELASIRASADATNHDDEHDPEGAGLAYERDIGAVLLDAARESLRTLQAARDRIDAGTYGRCEVCDEPIALERLEALPDAATCVRCA
jgi:DnaK suppressor protein